MSIKCTSLQNFDIIVCNKFVAHLGETFFMITIYYRYLDLTITIFKQH